MSRKQYSLISACFGLASCRRGAVRGPAALLDAGIIPHLQALGIDITDGGTLNEPLPHDSGDPRKKYFAEVLSFNEQLVDAMRSVYQAHRTPVIIGGDHSIAVASFSATAEHARQQQKGDIGLLWVDAHPDINTPDTTPSGNMHGMSVAHLLGMGEPALAQLCGFAPKIKPENIVFLGLRSVDHPEVLLIRELGITTYTMHEIDRYGLGPICEKIFAKLGALDGFALSFDLDVCDPAIAPGVGTPVRGGLTFRESHLIMEMAAELPGLLSIEMVEYNPDTDNQGTTADFAIGLLESAMGRRIL